MRRYGIAFALLIIVVLMGLLASQDKIEGPRISIDEPNFDFGFAPEGTFMVHEFTLRNIGTEPLEIKRVRTTCGCASAPTKKNLLQPGEETKIPLIFNSTRYFHKTSKAAIISTNDPTTPSEKITFIADMDTTKERAIAPNPIKIDVGHGASFARENKLKIMNISREPITIRLVDYYAEYLEEPRLATAEVAAKGEAEITVTVKQTIPGDEIIRASFTIAAVDKKGQELTRITVPVSGGGS